jgi:hypothetical protein
VTDSAGVRITSTAETPRVFQVVEETPVLRLGGADATGPELFSQVAGVRIDAAGNVWVLDGASSEVRIFRPDGTHWKTVGRRGEGPGEFQALGYLGELADDALAAWDRRLGRYSRIAAAGDSIRSVNLAAASGIPLQAVRVFADGSVLAKQATVLQASALEPGQLLGDTARLLRVSATGERHEPIALAPGPTWLWTGHSQVPLPYTINTPYAISGEDVLLADGREFRLRVYRAGRLAESFGVRRPPRAADAAAETSYREYLELIPAGGLRDDYLAALADDRAPDWLPGYLAVVVAADGTTWAQQYSPNPLAADRWDVFSPTRAWLGEVRLPAGFVVHEVGGGRIAGVWRDAPGVEYVQVLRLREPRD